MFGFLKRRKINKEWYNISDDEMKKRCEELVVGLTNGLEPFKTYNKEFQTRMFGLLASIAYSASLDAKEKRMSLDDFSNMIRDLINGWVNWIILNPSEAVKKSDELFPNGYIQS